MAGPGAGSKLAKATELGSPGPRRGRLPPPAGGRTPGDAATQHGEPDPPGHDPASPLQRCIMPRIHRATRDTPRCALKGGAMSLRGRLSMLGAVAIVVAACIVERRRFDPGPDTAAPTAAAPSAAAPRRRRPRRAACQRRPDRGRPAGQDPEGRQARGLHGPELPAAVRAEAGRHVRGLRHRRRHRDRQAARRRRSSSTTPDWDGHHRRCAGAAAGTSSVGSMTITVDRVRRCSTSATRTTTRRPRWPPARRPASRRLDGLAGKTVCVGEATTYLTG